MSPSCSYTFLAFVSLLARYLSSGFDEYCSVQRTVEVKLLLNVVLMAGRDIISIQHELYYVIYGNIRLQVFNLCGAL